MNEASNDSLLVSAKPVANRLGISPGAVRKMAEQRLLPCYRLSGGAIRFSMDEVIEHVAKHLRVPAMGEDTSVRPLLLSRPRDPETVADGDIRMQALVSILARMAGRIDDPEKEVVTFNAAALIGESKANGSAPVALTDKGAAKSIGKALARVRGKVLKDSRGRSFEVLREVGKQGSTYHFRF